MKPLKYQILTKLGSTISPAMNNTTHESRSLVLISVESRIPMFEIVNLIEFAPR